MSTCIVRIFQYISNTMQRYTVYVYLETAQHVSGGTSPIIRSAYNCIYSIWYLSHRYCYLPLSWKSWDSYESAVGGRVSSRGRSDHGWKHVHLHIHTETRGCNGSFKGLLIMGIVMPETFWAASIRQSTKFYDWLLHLVGVLFEWLKMHGITNPKFKKSTKSLYLIVPKNMKTRGKRSPIRIINCMVPLNLGLLLKHISLDKSIFFVRI
jgi:hypothetical protein